MSFTSSWSRLQPTPGRVAGHKQAYAGGLHAAVSRNCFLCLRLDWKHMRWDAAQLKAGPVEQLQIPEQWHRKKAFWARAVAAARDWRSHSEIGRARMNVFERDV